MCVIVESVNDAIPTRPTTLRISNNYYDWSIRYQTVFLYINFSTIFIFHQLCFILFLARFAISFRTAGKMIYLAPCARAHTHTCKHAIKYYKYLYIYIIQQKRCRDVKTQINMTWKENLGVYRNCSREILYITIYYVLYVIRYIHS